MRTMGWFFVSAALLLAPSTSARADWLTRDEYEKVRVSIEANPDVLLQTAADEFALHWEAVTGSQPVTRARGGSGPSVILGTKLMTSAQRKALDLDGLSKDGFHIKTVGKVLLIGAQAPEGVLWGVYEFFERFMGVRWFAPDETFLPQAGDAIPPIDFRYDPPIAWRTSNYWPYMNWPEFGRRHRINGQQSVYLAQHGRNLSFANGFGHTFFSFVSPDEYGASHPEYFSEADGRRLVGEKGTQLCLTNPDVLRIVTEKTRAILRNAPPNQRIVSVTQMDWGNWCTCAACRAIDEREESQSGTVLAFVNGVAEAIEPEFPDAFIDTFAYTYTRKPPKTLKPRDNVIVRLCSIECDFSKPLNDPSSRPNARFVKDIQKWKSITKNLWIWDYTQNWYSFQGPHPNIHVLQPNLQFFCDAGVSGVFEQASHAPHSDFDFLKAYLLARALWNPDVDWKVCYEEFLQHYYREAAPYIRAYQELIAARTRQDDVILGFFNNMQWMDADMVIQTEGIFERAFAAVKDDQVRERLKFAHVAVQYAALVCPPRTEAKGDKLIATRPPSQTFDEYWAMIHAYGMTHLADEGLDAFKERLEGKTPARYRELQLERLENRRYEVWLLPEVRGSVVRWYDKKNGINVFNGHVNPFNDRWSWQEWDLMTPDHPVLEEPLASSFEVVSRKKHEVTLKTLLDSGLEIERRMRLAPRSDELEVTWTLRNTTRSPLVPRMKVHPEFYVRGPFDVEVWAKRSGVWSAIDVTRTLEADSGFAPMDVSRLQAWLVRVPKYGFGILNRVHSEELSRVLFFFAHHNDHMNMEIIPNQAPLEAGGVRTVRATYAITGEPISDL